MVFNGHTIEQIDSLDDATMNEIVVMYADGIVGNGALLNMMGSLVTGVFNYIRDPKSPAYSLKTVLGNSYGYIFSDNETSPNDALLTFMTQAKGFSLNKFKKD